MKSLGSSILDIRKDLAFENLVSLVDTFYLCLTVFVCLAQSFVDGTVVDSICARFLVDQ